MHLFVECIYLITNSSILGWKIPWTEEPGGLYSPGGRQALDMTEQLSTQIYEISSMKMICHINYIYYVFLTKKLALSPDDNSQSWGVLTTIRQGRRQRDERSGPKLSDMDKKEPRAETKADLPIQRPVTHHDFMLLSRNLHTRRRLFWR